MANHVREGSEIPIVCGGEPTTAWRLGRLSPMPAMVPSGWSLVPALTVARLESGHTPSRHHPEYWNGGIPWVSLHDSKRLDVPEIVETSQTVSELGLANSSARLLPRGTVVFSRTATVGKATVLGREMSTSQDFANFVCGPRLHNHYLMQLFRALQPEWKRLMAGSTHNTIYMPVFRDLQLLLPPLPEQRKIAAILSSVDETIEKTEAVIEQLQVVKKAMMEELLTRGMPGRHTRFKQTEIGEVPEGWEVVELGACVREPIRNGYSPNCPSEPTGKWTLGLGAVGFDGFNAAARKPAPLDDPRVDSAKLMPGDLLLSRSNTRERVGLVGIYRGDPSPCSYPDLLMRIRPHDGINVEFLENTLLSARGRGYFEDRARGTSGSMVKVDRLIVESFPVVVPPIAEQLEIAGCLRGVDRRRSVELAAVARLRVVKDALAAALLSGDLRVSPDEASP